MGGRPPKGVPLKDIFKELTNQGSHLGACLPRGRRCDSPPASPLFLSLTPEAEPAQDVGGECETEDEEILKKWGPSSLSHCGLYLELWLHATRVFKPLKGVCSLDPKLTGNAVGIRQTHGRAGEEW